MGLVRHILYRLVFVWAFGLLSYGVSETHARSLTIGGIDYTHSYGRPSVKIKRIFVDESDYPQRLIVQDAFGKFYEAQTVLETVVLKEIEGYVPPATQRPADMISYGEVAYGKGDVKLAYFASPQPGYTSSAMKTTEHAKSLVVQKTDGSVYRFKTENGIFFEHRHPFVVDLSEDGYDDILAVEVDLDQGRRLAIYMAVGTQLKRVTHSPFIKDWINPIGVADFTGDGKTEIAYVSNPDANGYLEFYTLKQRGFDPSRRLYGFSNHIRKTKITGQSVVMDFNEDGSQDVMLLSNDHNQLVIASRKDEKYRRLLQLPLRRKIVSPFYKLFVTPESPDKVAFVTEDMNIHVFSRYTPLYK